MNIPEVLKKLEHIESYGYELGTDKAWLISTLREALKENEDMSEKLRVVREWIKNEKESRP